MSSCIVVFSGYNQRAVIAFLRVLHKCGIENYRIIAASENDTMLHTSYKKKVCYIRKHQMLNLDELMTAIALAKNECNAQQALLVPSTEALNRFLLSHRSFLEENGICLPLVPQAVYERVSDKEPFWKLCIEEGIMVPDLVDPFDTPIWPIMAKSKRYYASDGSVFYPKILKNLQDYKNLSVANCEQDLFFQEYVPGESYYLLYYFSVDGTAFRFSQKNYAQQSGGKSILVATCSNLHEDKSVTGIYEKLLRKLKYFGFIMFELRKHENQYYAIEANPRLWGPSQLFCDAGIPFFEAFLHDYGFLTEIPVQNIDVQQKYFWSGGARSPILGDKTVTWYGDGKHLFQNQEKMFIQADLYRREDTMKIYRMEYNKS